MCSIHSFIPLACAECGDSLPFSGASSILPYHIFFPATLLRQLCFHPPSLRPAIYFLVYLLVFLFPNSYTILFWGFYFLPFSVRVQTNVINVTVLSLLLWVARHYTVTHWRCGGMAVDCVEIEVQDRDEGLAQHDSHMCHRWTLWEGVIQRNTSSILMPFTLFRAISLLMVINSSFAVLVGGWAFLYMLICLEQNAGQHHNVKIGSKSFEIGA